MGYAVDGQKPAGRREGRIKPEQRDDAVYIEQEQRAVHNKLLGGYGMV